MVGAQTLLAFKSNGAMTVKTYNITSYGPITESKLSFEVWDLTAEESNGLIWLYAKLKVPNNADTVNQVWQVGSSVTSGAPDAHAMDTANKNSKSTLNLTEGSTVSTSGVDSRTKNKNVSFLLLYLLFFVSTFRSGIDFVSGCVWELWDLSGFLFFRRGR